MSNLTKKAGLGTSYDDKFTSMQIGKLRATVAEQEAEIERLCNIVTTQEDALKEFHAEIELLQSGAEIERLTHNLRIAKANYAGAEAEIERLTKWLSRIANEPSHAASMARKALAEDDDE